MIWNFAYTPQIWPAVLTTLLLIVLAWYAWYRRSVPGAIPFAIGSALGALWMAGYGMEVAAVDFAGKIFWVKFQAVWQLPATTAITCFILEYAWPGRWVTRRVLAIFSAPLLVFLALALTNNIHHLLWQGFIFDGTVIPVRAPLLVLFIIYGYLLFIFNIIVLVWLFWHSPPHRWPAMIMLTGQIGFRALYFFDLTNNSGLPIYVLGISGLILVYAIVLFGFRILDPVTIAKQALTERIHDCMVVINLQGKVEIINAAAERLFRLSTGDVKGKPISELIPDLHDEFQYESVESETELSLNIVQADSTQEIRYFTLTNTLLKDFRKLEVGRLILLHDITMQKQAQSQILEQQRALAMLNERNRLARELHDTIGQLLGYVSMQAQAIRKRARDGDTSTIDVQLTRLIEAAQAAHVDVRESILSLNTGSSENWSFPIALRQYMNAYQETFGIQTELTLPNEFCNRWFEPEAEVQLLRVIQEAMNNARKHSHASSVKVNFIEHENGIRIIIADNGQGFLPEHTKVEESGHYGLRFMRERAECLGGILKIESSPGKGTSIILQVSSVSNQTN